MIPVVMMDLLTVEESMALLHGERWIPVPYRVETQGPTPASGIRGSSATSGTYRVDGANGPPGQYLSDPLQPGRILDRSQKIFRLG